MECLDPKPAPSGFGRFAPTTPCCRGELYVRPHQGRQRNPNCSSQRFRGCFGANQKKFPQRPHSRERCVFWFKSVLRNWFGKIRFRNIDSRLARSGLQRRDRPDQPPTAFVLGSGVQVLRLDLAFLGQNPSPSLQAAHASLDRFAWCFEFCALEESSAGPFEIHGSAHTNLHF
jgi:hypothetical protein